MVDYAGPDTSYMTREQRVEEPVPKPQGAVDWARDTAIDVGKSFTGVVGDVGALVGNKDLADLTDKASYWLERGKSERGQWVSRNPKQNQANVLDDVTQAVAGMAGYVPVMAATALTGPAAPFVGTAAFGALGVGAFKHHVRTSVMSAPEETMWESSKYQKARAEGLDDHAARESVYDQVMEDIPSQVIAGVSGAVGGGLLTKAFGKMGSDAFAKAMTQRILGRTAVGAGEAFGGGLAQMGGQEYAGQRGERLAGIGPTESVAGALEAAVPPSLAFAALGGVSGAARRPPRAPTREPVRQPAEPIGTTEEAVARQQLAEDQTAIDTKPPEWKPQGAGLPEQIEPFKPTPDVMFPEGTEAPPPAWTPDTSKPGRRGGVPGVGLPGVEEPWQPNRDVMAPPGVDVAPTPPPQVPRGMEGPALAMELRRLSGEEVPAEQRLSTQEVDPGFGPRMAEQLRGVERQGAEYAPEPDRTRVKEKPVSIVDRIKHAIGSVEDNYKAGGAQINELKSMKDSFAQSLTELNNEIAKRRRVSSVLEMEPEEADAHRQETSRLVSEYVKGSNAFDLIEKALERARANAKAANPNLFRPLTKEAREARKAEKEAAAKAKEEAKTKVEAEVTVEGKEEEEPAPLGQKESRIAPQANEAVLLKATNQARKNLKQRGIRTSNPQYRELFNVERERLLGTERAAQATEHRQAIVNPAHPDIRERQRIVAEQRTAAHEAAQLARGEHYLPVVAKGRQEVSAAREREAAGIVEHKPPEPERSAEDILDKLVKGAVTVVKRAGKKVGRTRTPINPLLDIEAKSALRTAKARVRMEKGRAPEYAHREQVAEQAAKDHIGDPVKYAQTLDELLQKIYARHDAKGNLLPLDERKRYTISQDSLVTVARSLISKNPKQPEEGTIDWRLAKLQKAYDKAAAGYDKTKITWKIGRHAYENAGTWNAYFHELRTLRNDIAKNLNNLERRKSLYSHIINYYMAERAVAENKPQEAIRLLRLERQLLLDKYQARVNELMADPTANVDLVERYNKEINSLREGLFGSEYDVGSFENFIDNVSDPQYREIVTLDYANAVDQAVRESMDAHEAAIKINTERELPTKVKRELTPYQKDMVKRFGEGWLTLSNREKTIIQMGINRGMDDRTARKLVTYDVPIPEQEKARYDVSRAERLNELLVGLPTEREPSPEQLKIIHDAFREALGENTEEAPSFDTVQNDIYRAQDELDRLSENLRGQFQRYVPDVMGHEYGLARVLDRGVGLTEEGAMPAGSFRVKVSSLLKRGDKVYGLRPPDMPVIAHGVATDLPTNAVRNHFYDTVQRLLGDMDVVVLTPEQMTLAARELGLPRDAPAFYDPKSDRIFIDRDHYNSVDRATLLSHEFTHPITEEALRRFPQVRERLEKMFDQFRENYVFNPEVRERLQAAGQEQAAQNVHEFIAHLWQEKSVLPDILQSIKTSEVQRDQYRTERSSNVLVEALKSIKRGLTGMFFSVSKKRLLNDVTVASLDMFRMLEAKGREALGTGEARPISMGRVAHDAVEAATEKGRDLMYRFEKAGGASNLNNRGVFMRYLAERARRFDPGAADRADNIINVKGFIENTQQKIAAETDAPLMRKIAEYLGKGTRDRRENSLAQYIQLENYAGVSGSSPLHQGENAWVKVNEPRHRQAINRHPEVAREWAKLSPDEQALVKRMRSHMTQRHEDIRRADLSRLIEAGGILKNNDPAAIEAVIKKGTGEKLTPADEAALAKDLNLAPDDFEEKMKSWRRVSAFRKLEGPYYPMMRRGDYMVHGRFDVPKAIGFDESRILPKDPDDPTKFTFAGNADRDAFIDKISDPKHDYDFKITDVGEKYVRVNPEYLSSHDSERKAAEVLEMLKEDPNFVPSHLQIRRDSETNFDTPIHKMTAINQLIDAMKNSSYYRGLDMASQKVLERELHEMGIRHLMSSAARAKYLPRKYTLGADDDIASNVRQYLHNTSYTLAELTHRNEMASAVKTFDDYIRERRDAKDAAGDANPLYDENEKYGLQRSQLQREMHRRLAQRPEEHTSSWVDKSINLLMKLSYMGKLASPGFHILNSTEPWLLGAPIMAGEHGMKAYAELRRAYGVFGVGNAGDAMRDFKAVLREGIGGDPVLTDQVKSITDRIKASGAPDADRLIKLVDFLHRTQYLNRDAGMELGRILDPKLSRFSKIVDYIDMMSRAVGSAVEAQNRATTGVAAYRLEFAKTGNHEKAMNYAMRTLERSAGNYAWYNKPEIFNQRYARFALQFRQYALRVTQNYARMIVGSYHYLARNDANNPEVHAANRAAMHQLLALTASQAVVSGMLGLPTEPFKAIINAANAAGLSDYNSEQMEDLIRAKAAGQIGAASAEAFLRGLPRLLGTGLGERVAHSTLWTSGALGDKPDDWWRSLGHLAFGAPGDTAIQAAQGFGKVMRGFSEYRQGATSHGEELMIEGSKQLLPLKVMADALGVAHDTIWGKHTPSGQPTGVPIDTGTAVSNIMGIRTGRQMEEQEAKGSFIRARNEYNSRRQALMQAYATAGSPGEKADIRDRMRKRFNEEWPQAPVTVMDLHKYDQLYKKRAATGPSQLGMQVNRNTRTFLPAPGEVYRYQ